MAKIVKQNNQLAEAYDLVLADLFSSLKKLKDKGVIKLGDLGTIYKRKSILRSALRKKTYLFYQVSFKASEFLKSQLNKDL